MMTLTRILSIEDDQLTAKDIVKALNESRFSVHCIGNGADGLAEALKSPYDAITLDRMLPGLDGLSVLSTLRSVGNDTPVLMLSALGDVDERIRGLRAGGDDYLTKPFDPEEFAARLDVLLRRHTAQPPVVKTSLAVRDLELDLIARTACRHGVSISLLPTEYKLLEFLMQNAGRTITRTMLFEAVWGYHFNPGNNVIDVHMGRLRKKLDQAGLPPMITTIRRSGYLLEV